MNDPDQNGGKTMFDVTVLLGATVVATAEAEDADCAVYAARTLIREDADAREFVRVADYRATFATESGVVAAADYRQLLRAAVAA